MERFGRRWTSSRRAKRLMSFVGVAVWAAACGGSAPPPPPTTAAPAIKTAAERVAWYQECWRRYNEKAWDAFQDCYTDGAMSEAIDSTPPMFHGRAAIIENDKAFAAALPDRRGELKLVLGNGSHVASVALFTGTHDGDLPSPSAKPIPATHKKVGFLMAHTVELDPTGARAASDAAYIDEGTMMAQLGLLKAPARKAMAPSGEAATVVIAKNDDTESKNVAAFRAIVDAVNKHDLKTFEAALARDYKLVEVPQPTDKDKKAALASMKEFLGGFPDARMTAGTVWAAGDYVVASGTFEGTNTGNMPSTGLKKTGKKVSVRFIEIFQFENGLIKNDWTFYNGAALAAQLGMK